MTHRETDRLELVQIKARLIFYTVIFGAISKRKKEELHTLNLYMFSEINFPLNERAEDYNNVHDFNDINPVNCCCCCCFSSSVLDGKNTLQEILRAISMLKRNKSAEIDNL
jgi:hypothetical protein